MATVEASAWRRADTGECYGVAGEAQVEAERGTGQIIGWRLRKRSPSPTSPIKRRGSLCPPTSSVRAVPKDHVIRARACRRRQQPADRWRAHLRHTPGGGEGAGRRDHALPADDRGEGAEVGGVAPDEGGRGDEGSEVDVRQRQAARAEAIGMLASRRR
ncbi:MAG: hypothetical protein ACRD0K_03805 [Egibacteraceae bacterium]